MTFFKWQNSDKGEEFTNVKFSLFVWVSGLQIVTARSAIVCYYFFFFTTSSVDDHVVKTIKKTTNIYIKFELTQPNCWKKYKLINDDNCESHGNKVMRKPELEII